MTTTKRQARLLGLALFTVMVIALAVALATVSRRPPSALASATAREPVDPVRNSPWDGSVFQVKEWFRVNLKDPDSLSVIEWGSVAKAEGGYTVRCRYRARNSFGGYMVEDKVFRLDGRGGIVTVEDPR